jgi:hypothetical protein
MACLTWAFLLGRFSCPPPFVQPFLLVCQCTPRGFHPQQGKPCLFVQGALGKEGAVLSVIAICISQTHATKVGDQRLISTEMFREMFVSFANRCALSATVLRCSVA